MKPTLDSQRRKLRPEKEGKHLKTHKKPGASRWGVQAAAQELRPQHGEVALPPAMTRQRLEQSGRQACWAPPRHPDTHCRGTSSSGSRNTKFLLPRDSRRVSRSPCPVQRPAAPGTCSASSRPRGRAPPYRVAVDGVVAVVQLGQVLEVAELGQHGVLLGGVCCTQERGAGGEDTCQSLSKAADQPREGWPVALPASALLKHWERDKEGTGTLLGGHAGRWHVSWKHVRPSPALRPRTTPAPVLPPAAASGERWQTPASCSSHVLQPPPSGQLLLRGARHWPEEKKATCPLGLAVLTPATF